MQAFRLRLPLQSLWVLATFIVSTLTDFYLPATPQMALYLGVSGDMIQSAVTAYFGAFALMGFCAGILADRFGELTLFRAGFFIIVLGSTFCMFSHTITFLFLGRAIQGVGAGMVGVSILSLIRSYYPGDHASKVLAQTGMIFITGPFLAQWIGGYLTLLIGWKSCFAASGLLGLVFIFLSLDMFSDLEKDSRKKLLHGTVEKICFSSVLVNYRSLFKNKEGLSLLLLQPLILGGIWCYRSSLPFILMETYQVPLENYSYYLIPMVLTHLFSSWVAQKIVLKVGSQNLIQTGIYFLFCGVIAEFSLLILDLVTPLTLTLAFLPFIAGYSFSMSTSLATGIGRFDSISLAASLTVCLRMLGSASGGAAASYFEENSLLGLNSFLFLASLTSAWLFWYAFKRKKHPG